MVQLTILQHPTTCFQPPETTLPAYYADMMKSSIFEIVYIMYIAWIYNRTADTTYRGLWNGVIRAQNVFGIIDSCRRDLLVWMPCDIWICGYTQVVYLESGFPAAEDDTLQARSRLTIRLKLKLGEKSRFVICLKVSYVFEVIWTW